jgi:SAM-dependent methyltransferase
MYPADAVRTQYDTLLGRTYVWMAGGMEANAGWCRALLGRHAIVPVGTGTAVDLGAGCGFQSIPLAGLGFRVTAVDFSGEMLGILAEQRGSLPITIVRADILEFRAWTGTAPEVIVCMGDTLPHLPDMDAVRALLQQCARELTKGGKLLVSLRDYSQEPEGSVAVIPVRRDSDRIFLCRLVYGKDRVDVTDILYSRHSGQWGRFSGSYPKLRIAPDLLRRLLEDRGLPVVAEERSGGLTTLIADKV